MKHYVDSLHVDLEDPAPHGQPVKDGLGDGSRAHDDVAGDNELHQRDVLRQRAGQVLDQNRQDVVLEGYVGRSNHNHLVLKWMFGFEVDT